MPSESIEDFRNRTEAVRNIVMTVGVGVAAIWAVFSFFALRQSAIAEAALRESEERLAQWSAIEVSVQAKQLPLSDEDNFLIGAEVKLTNKGKRPARLIYKVEDDKHSKSNPAVAQLAVAKVEFLPDGSPQFAGDGQVFDAAVKARALNIPSRKLSEGSDKLPIKDREVLTWQLLRVGPTYTLPFVVKVTKPGLYFVDFRVRIGADEKEQEVYKKEFDREMPAATLSGSTFVTVTSSTDS